MKAFEIRSAVQSLQNYQAKREGRRSYWSPMLYTEDGCKKIIWKSTDREIRAAGVDVQEIRELARPPALFEYLVENGGLSCVQQ